MDQLNDNTKKKESKHLTRVEREMIERLLNSGVSKREIGRRLGRDLSVIKREIKRGSVSQRIPNKYQ
jgi:IS30 family transposase